MSDMILKLYDEYLTEEKKQRRKGRGWDGLRHSLNKFVRFLEAKNLSIYELDVKTALHYQEFLLKGKTKEGKIYAKPTVCWYLTAAILFCDFLHGRGILPANPFKQIKLIRRGRVLPKNIPNEKELADLLDAVARFDQETNLKKRLTRYRVHVVVELMYASGLRIMEVSGLREKDINFNQGIIEVREGKGNLNRIAYLTEYARDVLRLYLGKMKPLTMRNWYLDDKDLIFGISPQGLMAAVNRVLAEVAGAEGLPVISSHYLRHALGTHLLRAGCGIRHIQSILGHKLLRNTEIYTLVEQRDLKQMMDKYHPRQWRRHKDD